MNNELERLEKVGVLTVFRVYPGICLEEWSNITKNHVTIGVLTYSLVTHFSNFRSSTACTTLLGITILRRQIAILSLTYIYRIHCVLWKCF
jgi:hypothetical protein